MYWQLEPPEPAQVLFLLQSSVYRFWRIVQMINNVWMLLGVIWYLNRSDCDEAPDFQRLMLFVNILFWISISKYILILLIWCTLFCMLRVCPNHPFVVRLFGSMAQPFADGGRDVQSGLTAQQLSMFPVFQLPQPEGSPDHVAFEDRECAICLCSYEDDQPIKRLFCRHHYHAACIDHWLSTKTSCPLCNSNVLSHLVLPSSLVSAESTSPRLAADIISGSARHAPGAAIEGTTVTEHRIELPHISEATPSNLSPAQLAELFDGQAHTRHMFPH
jgi:hypothetical protein